MDRLRISDQETARVVAIYNKRNEIIGAGCLLSNSHILTCYHVVKAALDAKPNIGESLTARLIGTTSQPTIMAEVEKIGDDREPATDLALLKLPERLNLVNSPVEFATPLRHSGKRFSVLGFPDGIKQGRNASGLLHATDASGLVQMDGASNLFVKGGFSGAPVWSPDVGGFVGIVVTELANKEVAWCIPSRLLCLFYNDLFVRFRIPPDDRPQIHDYESDDPNLQIFGTVANDGYRKLTAKITIEKDEEGEEYYCAKATYQCLNGSHRPRGGYVTFVTHPSFVHSYEDAYELFGHVDSHGRAEIEFYPAESFTLAAIGDGGDTALTLDLSKIKNKPDGFE